MDDRGLATKFGIFDNELSGSYLSATQEIEVESDCVGLVLGGKSRAKMGFCNL